MGPSPSRRPGDKAETPPKRGLAPSHRGGWGDGSSIPELHGWVCDDSLPGWMTTNLQRPPSSRRQLGHRVSSAPAPHQRGTGRPTGLCAPERQRLGSMNQSIEPQPEGSERRCTWTAIRRSASTRRATGGAAVHLYLQRGSGPGSAGPEGSRVHAYDEIQTLRSLLSRGATRSLQPPAHQKLISEKSDS